MRTISTIISSAALAAALVACGGTPKGGTTPDGKSTGVPPPPNVTPTAATPGKDAPKREVSKEAKSDFQSAQAGFDQIDKANGWNESACRSSADKFQSVARAHPELLEAQYMVGLSFQRCALDADAEKAYQAAAKGQGIYAARALSNLGEIYFRAGKVDGAKQYWDSAVKASPKLVAAHNNLASLEIDQMRRVGEKSPEWAKLETDAKYQLSSALGVNTDSVKAYTLYGLLYMEGWQKNKNRLDLAKLLLDEAKKRNEKFAPLQNAYGLYYMHRNAQSEALQHFMSAVEADPKFVEARMNVGLTTVNFRKYDTAKEQFSKVIELQPKAYDAYVGLGLAQRGLGDMDGAEATYKKAIGIDGKKGDAYYNLGVLYKDFKANKQADLKGSQGIYKQAREFFKTFLDKDGDADDKAEAKNNITDCDKLIAQIDQFIQNQANQPPPPAAGAPAATPAPAPAAK